MIVLGVDTAQPACSVAIVENDAVRAARLEPMARGHAEALIGLVEATLAEAGLDFSAIDRFATTIGPGSFTGLRVGLAAARGMALALGRPVVGIGTLEALAAAVAAGPDILTIASFDARRDELYWQAFRGGDALSGPRLARTASVVEAIAALAAGETIIAGTGGPILAPLLTALGHAATAVGPLVPNAIHVARLAARIADPATAPAEPLYLREPDAIAAPPFRARFGDPA